MSKAVLESGLFLGPPILAAVLVASATVVWRRNLGSTLAVWVMIAIAALVLFLWGAFILALGIAGV